jgi:DNA primase
MNNTVLSQDEIIEIQKSVDIVDIISGYIPLTTKGKNFFGVCPFHPDHSPSMSVSREKQIYKCFACRASGNVFKFIMDYENVSFLEALRIVANKGGIPINIGETKKIVKDKTQVLYDIYEISQKYYKNNINTKEGQNARNFIENRHFDLSIIKEFDLGLSLKSYDSLTNLLIQKKFSQQDMIRTGLVVKSDKGYKDMYVNRIMFPLYDLTGKVVGYSGRIYNGEKTSKYFNTKETEIFKKGELLYNYHRAKDSARDKGQIIIVEGFFALIRLHTIGIDNVVATLGTAVTKKQALLIKRMAKEVLLCFDGDNAGNEATNSCINELNEVGVTPKIIRLEDNLDPDDYVLKYGKDRMLNKINNPMSIMDYKLKYHKQEKDLNNNQDLSDYVNEMINELKKIDDDIYKELTLKKLADESHLSIDILRKKLEDKEVTNLKVKTTNNIKKDKYEIAEENLLYYMLDSKDVVRMYNKEQPYILNPKYRILARELNNYLKEKGRISVAELLTYYQNNEEILTTIQELLTKIQKEEYNMQEIQDYINVIKERNINNEIKRLQKELKLENDTKRKSEILAQIIELKKI